MVALGTCTRWSRSGATHQGGTLSGMGTLADTLGLLGLSVPLLGTAIAQHQQVRGSEFMNALNAGGDTIPGVTYTVMSISTV
jgi:hypothetical protein